MGRGKYWQHSFEADTEEQGEPCARGPRCAGRDYRGNPKRGPRSFCHTDHTRIRDAIAELPQNYATLWLMLPASDQPGETEHVSGSRDAPVPVDLDIDFFLREIVLVTRTWEEQVRAAAHLSATPEDRRRDAFALTTASQALTRHLDTLLALPVIDDMPRYVPPGKIREAYANDAVVWTDEAGDTWTYKRMDGTAAGLEFLDLHGRIRAKLGLTRQRRRIKEVPCDQCTARTLVQYEARTGGWEPVVRCTNCPNAYIGSRYELLMGRVYQVQVQALDQAS
jgi:hypothetical protein